MARGKAKAVKGSSAKCSQSMADPFMVPLIRKGKAEHNRASGCQWVGAAAGGG